MQLEGLSAVRGKIYAWLIKVYVYGNAFGRQAMLIVAIWVHEHFQAIIRAIIHPEI